MISPDDLSVASKHLIYLIHFHLFLIQYNLCLSFSDFGLPYFLPIIFLVAFVRLQGKTSSYSSPVSQYCLLSWSVLKPLPDGLDPWSIWLWLCVCPDLLSFIHFIQWWLSWPMEEIGCTAVCRWKIYFFPFHNISTKNKGTLYCVFATKWNTFLPSFHFSSSPFLFSPSPPPPPPFSFQSSMAKERKTGRKKRRKINQKDFAIHISHLS